MENTETQTETLPRPAIAKPRTGTTQTFKINNTIAWTQTLTTLQKLYGSVYHSAEQQWYRAVALATDGSGNQTVHLEFANRAIADKL